MKKIIDKYIDNDIEVEYHEGDVSLETIRDFEKTLDYSLPEDFIEFSLSKYLPISIRVKEDIWPDPQCGDFGPAWTSMKGFYCNSFSENIHEDFFIPELSTEFETKGAVPFLEIEADSSTYCFLPDKKIHLLNKYGYESWSLDMSFLDFFKAQVQELVNRKNQYLEYKAGKRRQYDALFYL